MQPMTPRIMRPMRTPVVAVRRLRRRSNASGTRSFTPNPVARVPGDLPFQPVARLSNVAGVPFARLPRKVAVHPLGTRVVGGLLDLEPFRVESNGAEQPRGERLGLRGAHGRQAVPFGDPVLESDDAAGRGLDLHAQLLRLERLVHAHGPDLRGELGRIVLLEPRETGVLHDVARRLVEHAGPEIDRSRRYPAGESPRSARKPRAVTLAVARSTLTGTSGFSSLLVARSNRPSATTVTPRAANVRRRSRLAIAAGAVSGVGRPARPSPQTPPRALRRLAPRGPPAPPPCAAAAPDR